MKRHHYAVLFLVLVVGVLTGFVVHTDQAPTRVWEYGRLQTLLFLHDGQPESTAYLGWVSDDLTIDRVHGAEIFSALGCEPTEDFLTTDVFNCLGERGWELAAMMRSFREEDGVRVAQDTFSYFKRPAP